VLLGLESPRRRRRLFWVIGLALPLLAAAALIVFIPNTGESLETPIETGPAIGLPAPPGGAPIDVTPAVRRRVGETVERFSRTAMVRRRLDEAWGLASPTMKAGLTLAQWRRGELPVQPYPAVALDSVAWRIVERYPRSLLLDVSAHPKTGSGERIAVYSVELTATGRGTGRRFLVDSWVPLATLGGDLGPEPARTGGPQTPSGLAYDNAKLGPAWLLVPAAIVGLLVLTLIGLVGRSVFVRRRAERHYREQFRP
jgi:hypothetical protein